MAEPDEDRDDDVHEDAADRAGEAQAAAGDAPDEDGDVSRNPDDIQREIEQTRAELADTIDAIADRLSPKRAASRGASAVKAQVSSVLGSGDKSDKPSDAPASVLDAPPSSSGGPRAIGSGSSYTGTTQYAVSRALRTDRVLIVVGVAAAVTAVVVLRRSRR